MSGLSREEARPYDALLIKWYRQLAESTDSKISGSANYMIVSRLIRDGDYGKAQEILEDMPEKEAVLSSMADKQMLQIRLWLCQGETAKAIESLQRALFATLQKVQLLLCKMVDAELAEGQLQTARRIGDKAAQMVSLFDLWEYHSLLAPLQTASWEQDAQECIRLLRKMLAAMDTPWDMSSSPLFYRLAGTFDPKAMLPAIVSGLEQNTPETAFLHNHREFGALLSEYKAAQAPAAGNINHASDTGNAFFA